MRSYPARLLGNIAVLLSAAVCAPAQTWQLDPTFAPNLATDVSSLLVTSFVPTPSGQFLAYGYFTHVNGTATPGLARLGTDGILDPSFAPDLAADERVQGIATLLDGRVVALIGPDATLATASVDPSVTYPLVNPILPTTKLVRLRADGSKDPSFAALLINGSQNLTSLPDGRVLVWGLFSTIGGQSRNSLARLNADGTLDAAFLPAISSAVLTVSSVAVAADGTVVLSAVNRDANGNTKGSFFTRLLPSGAVDPGFAPGNVSSNFDLLAFQPDGSVLATMSGGTTLNRYLPTGALDRNYAAQIPQLQYISHLAPLPNGRLAVEATVGPANAMGAPAVFTLGANGQLERDFRHVAGGGESQRLLAALADGRVLVVQGTPVISPSYYPTVFDATATNATSAIIPVISGLTLANPALALSSIDANTLTPLPTTITYRYPGSINRLDMDSAGRVLVTGSFTQIDGQPRAGLARFLASGTLDPGFMPANGVLRFVPPDDRVIVSRAFIGPIGDDGFHRYQWQIVRLQLDGSVDTGFAFPPALDATKTNWLAATSDGRLLISAFDPDATQEQNLKLIWLGSDGRRGATLPAAFTGFTASMVIANETATAGAALNPVSIIYLGGTGLPNVLVTAQLLAGNQLLVAGAFSSVNGVARPGLVRLLGDGSLDASYVPNFDTETYSGSRLPLPDGRALVFGSSYMGAVVDTGSDSTILSQGRSYALRLRTDGSIDPTFVPPPDTIPDGSRRLTDGSFFSNGRHFFADGWPDLNFTPQFGSGTGAGNASYAALTADGRLWVGESFDQVNGQPRSSLARFAPVEVIGISVPPQSQTVVAGRNAYFQVALGTSHPATYQWLFNGAPLAGATGPTLVLSNVSLTQAGNYAMRVVVDGQTFTSDAATLTVTPNTARLVSFSARSRVTPGNPQIAGLVTNSANPRPVLVRAIGRGLLSFNVGSSVLPEPMLRLYTGAQAFAEDRGGATAPSINALAARVGAFPIVNSPPVYFPPGTNLGSALSLSLGNGVFTAHTSSGDANSGISLFEIYDAGETAAAGQFLRDVSVRGRTGTGADMLTAGFVVAGNGPLKVLVRGVGPTLAQFGVSGVVADPSIAVYRAGSSSPFASNDNWGGAAAVVAAAQRIGAFPLPAGSKDAALLLTLEPGVYTLQLTAADAAGGEALAEIYLVDP